MDSLIGGGNYAKPGEVSLSHNGVLFLDEIAEFNKLSLEALRQPMEDKVVNISRVKHSHSYPANFMLVSAMNPCSCGYYGETRCHCTDYEVMKYRSRISGPILDRIDMQKYVQPVNFMELSNYKEGRGSKELREIVEVARKIQVDRYKNIGRINCNAQMTPELIKEYCSLDSDSQKILRIAYDRFRYLTKDAELKTFGDDNKSVLNFTLAIRKDYIGSKDDPQADFIPVSYWNKSGQTLQKYLTKGRMVNIEGRISVRSYETQEGTKKYATHIIADEIQFLDSRKNDQVI
jgi:hypothetical protein